MFLLWGLAQSFAHPFEANLYGFSTEVRVFEENLDVRFEVEIPYKTVQKDLTTFIATQRARTMEEIKFDFLQNRSKELNNAISIEIDQSPQPCVRTSYSDQKLRKEGNFLVFFITCRVSITRGAHQISILHQYQEDAPSIFRNGVWIQRGIWLDDTSLKTHMIWNKEVENREVRLSIRILPKILSKIEQEWAKIIEIEPEMSLREYHKHPSTLLRFKRRQVYLYEACIYLMILLFLGAWKPSNNVRRDAQLFFMLTILAGILSWFFFDDRLLWGSCIAILGLLGRRFFWSIFWLGILVLPWWVPLPFVVPYFWGVLQKKNVME